jgi:long-chain acyl-CoA synthetase
MMKENMVQLIASSLRSNWELPAFSNYREKSVTYGEVADRILYLHDVFRRLELKRDDKIAVLGKNSVNWAIAYLAAVTYGAVIVPILPDFKPDDAHHIINHSDSILFFAADSLYENLDDSRMQRIEATFSLSDFSLLQYRKKGHADTVEKAAKGYLDKYAGKLTPEAVQFEEVDNKELAAIIYTSGTTGFSKGVMLPHNSLAANVVFAQTHIPLDPGDTIVSFLPIAHVFGCAFEFLFPFSRGCHITFLSKTPSPKVILKAFEDVRPRVIFSVPLVIEKIYNKQIKPTLEKASMQIMLKLPFMSKVIYKKVHEKLTRAFGGNFIEIIIGGAALNAGVEQFLRDINFRFTIGYGMTECGPLISYAGWKEFKLQSTGKLIDTLDIKIDSDDPYNEVGEILVRGENVMYGYYKNEEATRETLDNEGWMRTGDLGVIDKDDFVFIKGRNKSMILGPSGKNIYPEELEAKLDNMPFVQESIVVEREGQLVALVYPDMEKVDSTGISEHELKGKMDANRVALNQLLPSFMAISKIEIFPEEFEKTPKKSIKRFLYASK